MTDKQRLSLVYFITTSFFLASGYSILYKIASKDAWISMIIGTLIGILIIYIFNKYSFNEKKKYILNNDNNAITKIVFTIFFSFILIINIIILRVFTTSFYLTKTPGWFITIPFMLLCYYNCKKGTKTIAKEAEILFPISIVIIVLNMLFVSKDGQIDSFLPIVTTPISKILLGSICYAIFTSFPQLLLFDIKIEKKLHIKSYIITNILLIFIGSIIIYSLGPKLITIYRFPEYMVLKQIKIFDFIEKIENLVAMIWFFDLYISSSISLYNIDKLYRNKKITFFITLFVIIFVEIATYHYEISLLIYKYMPYLLLIFGTVFFINLAIKKAALKSH